MRGKQHDFFLSLTNPTKKHFYWKLNVSTCWDGDKNNGTKNHYHYHLPIRQRWYSIVSLDWVWRRCSLILWSVWEHSRCTLLYCLFLQFTSTIFSWKKIILVDFLSPINLGFIAEPSENVILYELQCFTLFGLFNVQQFTWLITLAFLCLWLPSSLLWSSLKPMLDVPY